MTLPAAGYIFAGLLGDKSKQDPLFGFKDQASITGSLVVKFGTYAPFGRSIKRTVVASLAVAASANAAYVNVTAGPTPDTVTVSVQKSDFTASTTATLVNIIAVIGSSVSH